VITQGFFSGFQLSRVFIQYLIHKDLLLYTYFSPRYFLKIILFLQSYGALTQQKYVSEASDLSLFKHHGSLQTQLILESMVQ